MRIRISALLMMLMVAGAVHAQLYPVFTQYYFNELMINPAYAGANVQLSATSTYRNQWINFPGAPKTISFTAHSSFFHGKVGLGLMINEDRIGSYNNKDITTAYSYKIKFPKSTLSFGVQAIFYFINADYSALNLIDINDQSFSNLRRFNPNVGAGIYYNRKNFFAGLSVPFLISSKFSSAGAEQYQNYFIRSGSIFLLDPKGNFKWNPNILIRLQGGQPMSMDINNSIIFYDVFSAGVSYRSGDAVIGFMSLKLSEKLYFNYSFDFTTSHLAPFSSGTQEFMLNYRAKITHAHKNLDCPTYHSYRE